MTYRKMAQDLASAGFIEVPPTADNRTAFVNGKIYSEAAALTGKSPDELKRMAEGVFASLLYHCAKNPGKVVWCACRVGDADRPYIDCEVDTLRPTTPKESR